MNILVLVQLLSDILLLIFSGIVFILALSIPNAYAIQTCSPSGFGCINWVFLDANGNPTENPAPVILDTGQSNTYDFKWQIIGQMGEGSVHFVTFPEQTSPGWIENCRPFSSVNFNNLVTVRSTYTCTITSHDGNTDSNLRVTILVADPSTQPFINDPNTTAESRDIDIRVVPEFGLPASLFLTGALGVAILAVRMKRLEVKW